LFCFCFDSALLLLRTGALKQWVDNQHKYDNYFCVVDMHAITNMHDKARLRQETLEAAAMYIAAGGMRVWYGVM
jgi:tryptophanyl-tRNA synthetase